MTPPLPHCHAPGPRLSSVVSSLLGQRSQIHATLEATECHAGCTRLQQKQRQCDRWEGEWSAPREPGAPEAHGRGQDRVAADTVTRGLQSCPGHRCDVGSLLHMRPCVGEPGEGCRVTEPLQRLWEPHRHAPPARAIGPGRTLRNMRHPRADTALSRHGHRGQRPVGLTTAHLLSEVNTSMSRCGRETGRAKARTGHRLGGEGACGEVTRPGLPPQTPRTLWTLLGKAGRPFRPSTSMCGGWAPRGESRKSGLTAGARRPILGRLLVSGAMAPGSVLRAEAGREHGALPQSHAGRRWQEGRSGGIAGWTWHMPCAAQTQTGRAELPRGPQGLARSSQELAGTRVTGTGWRLQSLGEGPSPGLRAPLSARQGPWAPLSAAGPGAAPAAAAPPSEPGPAEEGAVTCSHQARGGTPARLAEEGLLPLPWLTSATSQPSPVAHWQCPRQPRALPP